MSTICRATSLSAIRNWTATRTPAEAKVVDGRNDSCAVTAGRRHSEVADRRRNLDDADADAVGDGAFVVGVPAGLLQVGDDNDSALAAFHRFRGSSQRRAESGASSRRPQLIDRAQSAAAIGCGGHDQRRRVGKADQRDCMGGGRFVDGTPRRLPYALELPGRRQAERRVNSDDGDRGRQR